MRMTGAEIALTLGMALSIVGAVPRPGRRLALGIDSGTPYTSRSFCARLAERGVTHCSGG